MTAGSKFGVLLIAVGLFFCGRGHGQDGSNVHYLTPDKLDETFIGRQVHIDFYRDSRGCSKSWGKEQDESRCDKVFLSIDNKPVEFKEHRVDDGFNNWFSEQYLESTDKKFRLREFKLIGIGERTLSFIGYFNEGRTEEEFTFEKADIFKLLFKVVK